MNTITPVKAAFGFDPKDDLNDLRMSEKATPLYEHVKRFVQETVAPMSEKFHQLGEGRADRWSYAPGQLELLEEAKNQAKKEGLWNFFLPDADTGEGLSNLDYAYIAVELGKVPLASEVMNCSAPDTGNMEVLERVGTPEQKERWLKHERRPRERRVGDQRREVLHLRRRRPALQDHDHHGQDQP
jgi:acyl-CoA dehydrogenase